MYEYPHIYIYIYIYISDETNSHPKASSRAEDCHITYILPKDTTYPRCGMLIYTFFSSSYSHRLFHFFPQSKGMKSAKSMELAQYLFATEVFTASFYLAYHWPILFWLSLFCFPISIVYAVLYTDFSSILLSLLANFDSETEMQDTEASHHKLSDGSSSINLNITSSPIEGDNCSGRGLSKEVKAVEDLVFFFSLRAPRPFFSIKDPLCAFWRGLGINCINLEDFTWHFN